MVRYVQQALAVEVQVFAVCASPALRKKIGGNSTDCRPKNMHLHLLTVRPAAQVEA